MHTSVIKLLIAKWLCRISTFK